MNLAPSSTESPFHLTIRFTTGHDDLPINIPNPSETTTTQLKKQIRAALPEDIRNNRLRLIAAGKLLHNGQILSNVLKAPLPPPPPPTSRKGKEPVLPPTRIYINCSIGDKLSEEELAQENDESTSSSPPTAEQLQGQIRPHPRPEPRGFDRLLSSMSAQEVAELRAEFMAVQASRFTPDTMPSATTLRRMEDAWLDEGGDNAAVHAHAHGAHEQELDDFFWGNLMGFLWPIGIIGWAGRDGPEGGLWSDRRKTAVWTGVAMSLAFGIVREMSYLLSAKTLSNNPSIGRGEGTIETVTLIEVFFGNATFCHAAEGAAQWPALLACTEKWLIKKLCIVILWDLNSAMLIIVASGILEKFHRC